MGIPALIVHCSIASAYAFTDGRKGWDAEIRTPKSNGRKLNCCIREGDIGCVDALLSSANPSPIGVEELQIASNLIANLRQAWDDIENPTAGGLPTVDRLELMEALVNVSLAEARAAERMWLNRISDFFDYASYQLRQLKPFARFQRNVD